MYVPMESIGLPEAKDALAEHIPNFDRYLSTGQMDIVPTSDWYLKDGRFEKQRVMDGWRDKQQTALAQGYAGLRVAGNTFWVGRKTWREYIAYETSVNKAIHDYKMLALCPFSLDLCQATDIIDVISTHEFAVVKQEGAWNKVENSTYSIAKSAQTESEGKYRALYENSLDAILLTSPDGSIESANLSACLMFGMSEQELMKAGREGVVDKSDPRLIPALEERARTGRFRGEIRFKRKDGTVFTGELSNAFYLDRDGQTKVAQIIRDVTEREKAEEELRENEKRQAYLLRLSDALRPLADPAEIQEAACRVLGEHLGLNRAFYSDIENEECLNVGGQFTREVQPIPPGRYPVTAWGGERVLAFLRNGLPIFIEDINNDPAWVAVREAFASQEIVSSGAMPLLKNGRLIAALATHARTGRSWPPGDVALVQETAERTWAAVERARAEKALRKSEERFRALVTASSEVLYCMSPDWSEMRQLHSRGFLANTEELNPDWLQAYIPPEDQPGVIAAIKEAVRNKHSFQLEHRVIRADGTVGWTSSRAIPLLDSEGEIAEWFGAASDVTEQKRIKQAKDEFIGMVSHELKTPLTVIIGALAVARNEKVTLEQVRELLADAYSYADALAHLVDNLLELSRYQSKRLTLKPEAVYVAEVARETVRKVAPRTSLHKFVLDFPQDRPRVMMDKVRLERVLSNLIDNAVKYSPNGGEVRVFYRQEGGRPIVGIRDQGIGISPENQRRLFHSFERVEAYENHTIPGLGLGLKVCQILVEAHCGSIWVESQIGKGSTFYFSVPLAGQTRH